MNLLMDMKQQWLYILGNRYRKLDEVIDYVEAIFVPNFLYHCPFVLL